MIILEVFMYKNMLTTSGKFGWRKFSRDINLGWSYFNVNLGAESTPDRWLASLWSSTKPWVAKRSHHLRQTAKISERHSWQFLGVASIFLEAFNLGRSGWVRRRRFWKDWVILFTNSSLFACRWFSIVLSGALRLHGSGWNAFAR